MRRVVGSVLVLALVAGLLALAAGCGQQTSSGGIITPQGKITVKKSGSSVTVTKNGKTQTWDTATIAQKALGVPVPSDAKLISGTAIQVSKSAEKWQGATFYTNDEVPAVMNYYKAQLSKMSGFSDTSTTLSNQPVGLYSVQSGGTVKSVIVRAAESGEQGKTWIQIATVAGAGS
jgi:hypothetical protein